MRLPFVRVWRKAALFSILPFASMDLAKAFSPSEPGLYAVFDTSEGEFAAALLYEESPMTVANFIGLAEGSQVWFDEQGVLRNDPYYDGIAIHGVIRDFVIQAGSRDGTGFDGPGYAVNDEINVELSHAGPGVLSMDNFGPNTNGGLFLITLDEATDLDLKNPIFGYIVDGLDEVFAIGETTVDANYRPISDIVIHSVTIVREGQAAAAFDAGAWQLPKFTDADTGFRFGESRATLEFQRQAVSEYFLLASDDLRAWEQIEYFPPSGSGSSTTEKSEFIDEISAEGRRFFQVGEFTEPQPVNAAGSKLTINLWGEAIAISFGDEGGGLYSIDGQAWSIDDYKWLEVGNLIQVIISYRDELQEFPMQLYFNLTEANEGSVLACVLETELGAGDQLIYEGSFTFAPAQ